MDRTLERYHMTFDQLYGLYGKYVGNWGGKTPVWRFDAVENGQVTASVTRGPSTRLHLEATACATLLTEGSGYDTAAVRIRVLDEFGNVAPYAQLPVKLTVTGAAALIGPDVAVLEGGCTGAYVRTVGRPGEAILTLTAPQTEPVTVRFQVEERE